MQHYASLVATLAFFAATHALNPSCAPGGNFDLSKWTLQLPFADSDDSSTPQTEGPSALESCNGYQDPGHHYFFTESGDGAMVMKVPGDETTTDCVSFSGSHPRCRTEFKETVPSSWSTTASKNRLSMTLLATAGTEIVIGQAFQVSSNSKPVAEIYYASSGDIDVGVEKLATGGEQNRTHITNIPFGTAFTYELRYESGNLGIAINGGSVKNLPLYFTTDRALFKAGNYNQKSDPSDVHVFALSTSHAS